MEDIEIEAIVRRLSVRPVKSMRLNSDLILEVFFEDGCIVRQKVDTYFRMFLAIADNLERIEKVSEDSVEKVDARTFVPDSNPRFRVFGLERGDIFRSVKKSGVEFFTRLEWTSQFSRSVRRRTSVRGTCGRRGRREP